MVEHSMELCVGEVLRIGEVRLEVLAIDSGEVTFRVEGIDAESAEPLVATTARLPR